MRFFSRHNRSLAWLWLLAMVLTLAGRPAHAVADCAATVGQGVNRAGQASQPNRAPGRASKACGMAEPAATTGEKNCCCGPQAPVVERVQRAAHGHRVAPSEHPGTRLHRTRSGCGCQLSPAPPADPADSRPVTIVPQPDMTALPAETPSLALALPAATLPIEAPDRPLPTPDRSPTGSRAPPAL